MTDLLRFSDAEKAEAAEREVRQHRKVYPRLVQKDAMTQRDADYQIAVMAAIAEDYRKKDRLL